MSTKPKIQYAGFEEVSNGIGKKEFKRITAWYPYKGRVWSLLQQRLRNNRKAQLYIQKKEA